MQDLLIHLPLIFFTHLLDQSNCFVTQLPECGRYRGNFSVRHDDQFFEVIKPFSNFHPLEPQIFENRSNLASNCRASNRKYCLILLVFLIFNTNGEKLSNLEPRFWEILQQLEAQLENGVAYILRYFGPFQPKFPIFTKKEALKKLFRPLGYSSSLKNNNVWILYKNQ